MSTDQVVLQFAPNGRWAALRDLCGADESAVEGTGTPAAIALVNRLLAAAPGTGVGPGMAASLTASDRDRILAAVYTRAFGAQVQSTVVCGECGESFDLDFRLDQLAGSLSEQTGHPPLHPGEDGLFTLDKGVRFRLPTGEDECSVIGMTMDEGIIELAKRCIVGGDTAPHVEMCQQSMEEVAPIIDLDLDAVCPNCDAAQSLHFDLQHYLLQKLMAGRRQLAAEVHSLANAYGWGLNEILQLSRSQRRIYAELVAARDSARRRS